MKTKVLILFISSAVYNLKAQSDNNSKLPQSTPNHHLYANPNEEKDDVLDIWNNNPSQQILSYECPLDTIYEYEFLNPNTKVVKYRHIYLNNEFNNPVESFTDRYLFGIWDRREKRDFTYDSQQRLTANIRSIWINGAWEYSSSIQYAHPDHGLIITYQNYINGEWVNTNRKVEDYGDLIETYVTQNWESGSWINNRKETITYNTNKKMVLLLAEEWKGGIWKVDFLRSFTYNSLDLLIQRIVQVNKNGIMVNSEKNDYKHDTNKNLKQDDRYVWANNTWQFFRQTKYFWSQNVQDSSIITQANASGMLVNLQKVISKYDAPQKTLYYEYFNWENEKWLNDNKSTYEYNIQGFTIARDVFTNWSPAANDYLNHTRQENRCTLIASGVEPTDISTINIYPNPFYGDHFSIYTDLPQRYKVYNLAGKLVGQGDLYTGENEIYIPMLSQGMYILKVGNLSKRIIKL